MSEKTIAFTLYPGVTLLDLVGPLQVLKNLPSPFRTVVVSASREAVPTDTGLRVTGEESFGGTAPVPYGVIVPGGPGTIGAMVDDALQGYLRGVAEGAAFVGSVCTGSLVLAAAGLLEGRRATTHWAYARELEKLGATYVRERWVEDGKFITAAGVSAGIDLAIALAGRLAGEAVARAIQLGIEYDPQPPFGGIDWDRVGDAELARQRGGGTGGELEQAAEVLARRPDLLAKLMGG